jgi:hypothetical protein
MHAAPRPLAAAQVSRAQLRCITAATIELLVAFRSGAAPVSNDALEPQGTCDASAGAQITNELLVHRARRRLIDQVE